MATNLTRDELALALEKSSPERIRAIAVRSVLRALPLCIDQQSGHLWNVADSALHVRRLAAGCVAGVLGRTDEYVSGLLNLSVQAFSAVAMDQSAKAVEAERSFLDAIDQSVGAGRLSRGVENEKALVKAAQATFAIVRSCANLTSDNQKLWLDAVSMVLPASKLIDEALSGFFLPRAHFAPAYDGSVRAMRNDLSDANPELLNRPLWTGYVPDGWDARWNTLWALAGSASGEAGGLMNGIRDGKPDLEGLENWLLGEIGTKERRYASSVAYDREPTVYGMHRSFLNSGVAGYYAERVAERDSLRSERFVEALQSLISERADTQHFSIGLFGDWGRGKSSFVGFLKKKLSSGSLDSLPKRPEFLVAEFNAWKNEKASNHGAMLAQAVVETLTAELGFFRKLSLALALNAKRQAKQRKDLQSDALSIYAGLKAISPGVIFAVSMLVFGGFLLYLLMLQWLPIGNLRILGFSIAREISASVMAGLPSLLLLWHGISRFLRTNLTEWFKCWDVQKALSLIKLPDYGEHRGLFGEIHKTLAYLCALRLGPDLKKGEQLKQGQQDRHLLLVIDDLDRCSIDTMKEVLDAVRLVADIPRVVTLVAIDPRMAYAAVEKHYDNFGHAGRKPSQVARDYLGKIFQLSLRLPTLTSVETREFINNELMTNEVLVKEAEPLNPGEASSTVSSSGIPKTVGSTETPRVEGGGNAAPSDEGLSKEGSGFTETNPLALRVWPEERRLFQKLVDDLGFGNPRLMQRLYFAWSILKFLVFDEGYERDKYQSLMRLLFWREWFLQHEVGVRKQCERWFDSGEGAEPSFEGFAKLAGELKTLRSGKLAGLDFTEAVKRVDLVLLPASESVEAGTALAKKDS